MAKRRRGSSRKDSGAKKPRSESGKEDETTTPAVPEQYIANLTATDTGEIAPTEQQIVNCTLALSQTAGNLADSQDFDEILCANQGAHLDDLKEIEENKNAVSTSVQKMADHLEKLKKDLIQIREYVDHWKQQFEVVKRDHAALLKSEIMQKPVY
ncbi:hypothetical protein ACHWQZ_G016191 [Mnemiopsis leidyi]